MTREKKCFKRAVSIEIYGPIEKLYSSFFILQINNVKLAVDFSCYKM